MRTMCMMQLIRPRISQTVLASTTANTRLRHSSATPSVQAMSRLLYRKACGRVAANKNALTNLWRDSHSMAKLSVSANASSRRTDW